MAFDPTLPLQIHIPTHAETLSKMYALQGMQQENQQRALQLQDAQQQVDQRNAVNDALRDNTDASGNLNRQGALSALYRKGFGVQAATLGHQWTVQDLELQKQQQEAQKAKLEAGKQRLEAVGQYLNGVSDQRSWDDFNKWAVTNGVAQPGEYPAIYDPQFAAHLQSQSVTYKDHIANLLQQAQQNETGRHNAATEAQAAATADETQRYHNVETGQRRQQLGIEAGRLNVERQRFAQEQQYLPANGAGLTGDAFLQTLSPNVANQVKAVAAGDVAMPNSRSSQGMAFRNAVLNYDPTYTDARFKGKNAFKTGKDADTMKQSAAMLEHLERSLDNSDKLGVSPSLGTGATLSGGAAAYRKDIDFYTGELGKLITNGSTTEGEAHRLLQGLQSPFAGVRRDALNEMTNLAKGNINALAQKYKNATGMDLRPEDWFDKPTQQRLQKYQIFDNGQQGSSGSSKGSPAGGFNWNAHPEVQ